MIGREKELEFIKDGFSKFGHLRCAITLGPEGIGKSTFLEEAKVVHSLKEGKSISITPDFRNIRTYFPSYHQWQEIFHAVVK